MKSFPDKPQHWHLAQPIMNIPIVVYSVKPFEMWPSFYMERKIKCKAGTRRLVLLVVSKLNNLHTILKVLDTNLLATLLYILLSSPKHSRLEN